MSDQALHELDGPRAKLARAAQQARTLAEHCRVYEESRPIRLEYVWEDDAHIVYVRPRLPPLYLGLILGEVVHDLRSAFDQVAWALASAYAGAALEKTKVARAISFPIASTEAAFMSHPARPYFDPEALAVMEQAQPYKNSGTPRVNPLAIVQDWSNRDKHRVLQPALGRIALEDFAYQTDTEIDQNDFEMLAGDSTLIDHTKGLLRIPAPRTARIAFLPPPVHVCFASFVNDPPEPANTDDIKRLVTLSGECLDAFARFFPNTEWEARIDSWITPELPGT